MVQIYNKRNTNTWNKRRKGKKQQASEGSWRMGGGKVKKHPCEEATRAPEMTPPNGCCCPACPPFFPLPLFPLLCLLSSFMYLLSLALPSYPLHIYTLTPLLPLSRYRYICPVFKVKVNWVLKTNIISDIKHRLRYKVPLLY